MEQGYVYVLTNPSFKEAINTKTGKVFYEKNKEEINYLKNIRDAIYSHSDLDFEKKTKSLTMDSIKNMINFICGFLDIENSPISPKNSSKYFYISVQDYEKLFKGETNG